MPKVSHSPHFVREEFEAYLKCGRLEYGFLRVKCDACRHEKRVAFSGKRRGFCPSCGARRMAETAAHLVEHVLPEQPIRQWVLSFPYPLRFLLATRPAVLTQVLGIVYRAVSTCLVRRAALGRRRAHRRRHPRPALRIGSEPDPHLHMLFLDGAYTFDDEAPRLHRVAAPTQAELQRLLHAIATRTTRALERQGLLSRDEETPALDLEPADDFEPLLGAAVHDRIATGPHAGRKALTLRTVGSNPPPDSPCIAQLSGFSLHAGTCCRACDRDALERLCRSIARPALSNERLSVNDRGQAVVRLKHPFGDGTTHVVLDPIDFMRHIRVPHPFGAASGCANRQSCRLGIARLAAPEVPLAARARSLIETILTHLAARNTDRSDRPRAPPLHAPLTQPPDSPSPALS